jgi:4'-phosphopantetheinyl transferase
MPFLPPSTGHGEMVSPARADAIRIVLVRLHDATDGEAAALDAGDRRRFEAMTSPRRRQQFVAGRQLARTLAAALHGDAAEDWGVETTATGAPRLVSRRRPDAGLHVSIAHSADRVACVVAPVAIGIDLEAAPRPRDLLALAGFVFPPGVRDELAALDAQARQAAFYRTWALAEAHGKRSGEGLRWQESRRRRFVASAPAEATHLTWQGDDLTLALAGAGGLAVVVDGWDAPPPCGWRVEAVD